MNESLKYVGIISPLDLFFTSLKREAFLFDTIAIPNISQDAFFETCPIKALPYLIEKQIVIDPVKKYLGSENYLRQIGHDVCNEKLQNIDARAASLAAELAKADNSRIKKESTGFIDFILSLRESIDYVGKQLELGIGLPITKVSTMASFFFRKLDYDRRGIARDLRQDFGVNAFPVSTSSLVINDEFLDGKKDIVELTLNMFPEPDMETTTWEQIIDFREDEDSIRKLVALRNWINELSRKEVTRREFVETASFYCNEYEQHMKLHKMKVNNGILKTFLMVTAEALEGLLRLKPTQTIEALYMLKHRQVQLYEAELTASRREIAYVVKAREQFTRGNPE